jgi:hypothetical protein
MSCLLGHNAVTLFRMTVAEDDDKDLSWVFYNAQRSEEIVSKTEVRGSISEVGYNNACDRLNQVGVRVEASPMYATARPPLSIEVDLAAKNAKRRRMNLSHQGKTDRSPKKERRTRPYREGDTGVANEG